MAKALTLSTKRLKIDKASTIMVVAIAVTSFIVVFTLVASKTLLSQRAYQTRVITKKEKARDQLKKNVTAVGSLINSYKGFVSTSQNMLGGNPSGNGPNDGDNAKIVLDALPSQYDFPALATSLEKLLKQNGIKINSINGSDDQLTQQKNISSTTPQPVEMPFSVGVAGSYISAQNLISVFERSIRPFQIDSLKYSGKDADLTLEIKAKTFYQPEKDLQIKSVVVK